MFRKNRFSFLLTAAAVFSLLEPAVSQRSGGSTPAPPSGGTAPGGNTGGPSRGPGNTNQTPNPIGQQNQNNPQPTQPIFLSGRIMMDDGSELPRNVAIERVCGSTVRIEGYANSKGYFNIELGGRNVDALQDASTSTFDDFGGRGNFGQPSTGTNGNDYNRQMLLNCELRARAAGYESQRVNLATRQQFDNPDLGTILLHRLAPTEGSTISATALAAPKNAKKALQKGLDLEKKKKLEEAQASLQQAVDIYPKYAQAWFELGRLQAAQGHSDAARKSFDEAIHADSNFIPPYIQISMIELQAQRWQELADVSEKAVRLDSFGYPQAFFLNAVANYNLHHVDIAEQSARKAEKLDPRHQIPQVSHLLGVILADRHDYAAAAGALRDYLKFAPQAGDAAAVRSQLESFEKQAAATPPPQ
jgi:tetratricopeptide (TPR) repeat protein